MFCQMLLLLWYINDVQYTVVISQSQLKSSSKFRCSHLAIASSFLSFNWSREKAIQIETKWRSICFLCSMYNEYHVLNNKRNRIKVASETHWSITFSNQCINRLNWKWLKKDHKIRKNNGKKEKKYI